MIYRLSDAELKEAQTIEESYQRLIKECEDRIAELRPDGYDDQGLPNVEPKDFEKWLAAGSDEWREERKKRLELVQKSTETIRAYFESVYDAHFKKIAGDPDAIEKDAIEEIDDYIPRMYKYYSSEFNVGFSAFDVRATEDGFLLDTDETVKALTRLLTHRHFKALKKDKKRTARINEYLVKVVDESALTSSTAGELGGRVTKIPKPVKHETTEKQIVAVRPKDYLTTVDRITKQIFSNELIRPTDADPEAFYDVRLDDKGKVFARVAIDYKELLGKGTLLALPELNEKDYNVHDAILTLINAGNRVMSYDMIYRAMTGKVSGKITVPDEARKTIDEALEKFRGTFQLEYEFTNKDGETVVRSYDEPLVTFQRIKDRLKINGKIIAGGIRLSDDTKLDPPLLRWARENGNEIDTRDITLLDVPRLNNGDESFTLKMCLYRRLISMRNTFERKKGGKYELADKNRTIRYDYVYAALGLNADDLTKDKRHDIKDKIDRCMKYWASKGLISGYEHKKDKSAGNQYYAVMVSFMPKK